MADEINLGVTLKCDNASFKFEKKRTNVKSDQATQGGGGPGTQNIAITEESYDMTGYRRVWIDNLDDTNFVELGFATGVYPLRLSPGAGPTVIEVAAAQTLFLKSDTAACNVDIFGLYQ